MGTIVTNESAGASLRSMRTLERDENAVRPAVAPPWAPPPAEPCPGTDETHVWFSRLNLDPPQLESLRAVLSDDETRQASRFAFETHQRRYVAAHGILRNILGRYLRLTAEGLQFLKEDPHGKPSLADGCGDGHLRFNMSHSDESALFAVTWGREVGVDIERIRPDVAAGRIAERFFASGEVAALRSLPESEQPKAFFRCWTRKEAYLKATGRGLSLPLRQFEVSVAPGQPAALLSAGDDPEEAARWSLRDLDVGSDFAAALCVEGEVRRLRLFHVDSREFG